MLRLFVKDAFGVGRWRCSLEGVGPIESVVTPAVLNRARRTAVGKPVVLSRSDDDHDPKARKCGRVVGAFIRGHRLVLALGVDDEAAALLRLGIGVSIETTANDELERVALTWIPSVHDQAPAEELVER